MFTILTLDTKTNHVTYTNLKKCLFLAIFLCYYYLNKLFNSKNLARINNRKWLTWSIPSNAMLSSSASGEADIFFFWVCVRLHDWTFMRCIAVSYRRGVYGRSYTVWKETYQPENPKLYPHPCFTTDGEESPTHLPAAKRKIHSKSWVLLNN